jgi:hypothetical protein
MDERMQRGGMPWEWVAAVVAELEPESSEEKKRLIVSYFEL